MNTYTIVGIRNDTGERYIRYHMSETVEGAVLAAAEEHDIKIIAVYEGELISLMPTDGMPREAADLLDPCEDETPPELPVIAQFDCDETLTSIKVRSDGTVDVADGTLTRYPTISAVLVAKGTEGIYGRLEWWHSHL